MGQVGGFPRGAFPPTWLKLPPDNLDISFSGSDILSVVELTLALSSPCFHQEGSGNAITILRLELGSIYGHD